MRCSVCYQDYKQSDIIDNYFVKDTTEATSTSDEKSAQVRQNSCFVQLVSNSSAFLSWFQNYLGCCDILVSVKVRMSRL